MPCRASAAALLVAAGALLAACGDDRPPRGRVEATGPLPAHEAHQPGVAVGGLVTTGPAGTCVPCHADVDERYRTSGMRASLTLPTGAGSVEAAAVGTSYVDPDTGMTVRFGVKDGRYVQTLVYVDPAGVERAAFEMPVDLVIGSGHATRSYLGVREGRILELPLTWYRQKQGFALSPGDWFRDAATARVYARCIECHAGDVTPSATVPHRFEGEISLGITCRRCHGEAPEHARTGKPADVVHPANLDVARQEDLCAQCHLAGVASHVHRGRSLARDYRPGSPLASLLGVFRPVDFADDPASGTPIAGHAERLRASRCSQESGREGRPQLVCTTCHDPHEGHGAAPSPANRLGGCATCHTAESCSLPVAERGERSCASCHMATVPSSDIQHTRTTDHWIQRRPTPPVADGKTPAQRTAGALGVEDRPLENLLDPSAQLPGSKALMATAYLDASIVARSALGQTAPGYVRRAREHLDALSQTDPDDRTASFLRGLERLEADDHAGGEKAFREHLARFGRDDEASQFLAWALLQQKRFEEAVATAAPLFAEDPFEELTGTILAAAHVGRGESKEAVAALAAVRERLGPSFDRARRMIDAASRAKDLAREVEAAYDLLLLRPRDPEAMTLAAHVIGLDAKDFEQGRLLLREALRRAPDLPDALVGLARLEDDAGNRAEAVRLAERAEEVSPGIAEVRRILRR